MRPRHRRPHFAEGDYITKINGRPVTSVGDVCDVAASNPGGTVRVDGRYLASASPPKTDIGEAFQQDMKLP